MKRRTVLLLLMMFAIALPGGALADKDKDKAAKKRDKVDRIAVESLDELFEESPEAKKLYDKANGYAVFSSLKLAFGVSGGGGSGVAVEKDSGERTYMRMGTAGVGFGAGGKRYTTIFLFQTAEVFKDFVNYGWQADASAGAAAGTDGVGVASTFTNGLAIYQFSKKGLIANAEIAGTKYWKSEKLN